MIALHGCDGLYLPNQFNARERSVAKLLGARRAALKQRIGPMPLQARRAIDFSPGIPVTRIA